MTEWMTGGVLAVVALGAGWFDVRERRIPNALTTSTLVIALTLRTFAGLSELGAGLLGGALCFLFAVPFFAVGGLGGGDVKLLTAFGALLGPDRLLDALVVMALAGGALAFYTMARRRVVGRTFRNLFFMLRNLGRRTASGWRRRNSGSWMTLDTPGAVTVPYGVAISIGALYAWFF